MQDTTIASLTVGGTLLVFGGSLLYGHLQSWRKHQANGNLDARDLRFYRTQFRRRAQIAGMLIALGVLIPVGDILVPWARLQPLAFVGYWMTIVFLTLWMALMAMFDWLTGRLRNRLVRSAMARLERQRAALEEEADRLRRNPANRPDPGNSTNGTHG